MRGSAKKTEAQACGRQERAGPEPHDDGDTAEAKAAVAGHIESRGLRHVPTSGATQERATGRRFLQY